MRGFVKKYWHLMLAGGIFAAEALILFVFNRNIYAAVCDNLDLFITHLKLLKDNGAFFAHNKLIGILGGIDRDYLPTEFSLYNILYLIFPDIYAYILGYLMKLLIAFGSWILLFRHILKADMYKRYEKLIVLTAAAYALLPVYPMYGMCFASIPLIIYLLVRIYEKPEWWMYAAVFCYPLVSYFSFFGAFILGYLLIAVIALAVRDKRVSFRMIMAFFALFGGYACFEYRLFGIMLGGDVETIRSAMVIADLPFNEVIRTFFEAFLYGDAHSRSVHTYFILPVCAMFFIINVGKIVLSRTGKHDDNVHADMRAFSAFCWVMLFIIFNSAVYALYYCGPVRKIVELIPWLKGFSYARTIYFNTFGWYAAFLIVLIWIYDNGISTLKKNAAFICALLSIVIVGSSQCEYSDFYNTVYCQLYKAIKHTEVNQLSFNEFYGGDLIGKIKSDISYSPEQKACVYGFHPAMLSYNGIATVDGYCGYYPNEYKERFRRVIAPTLENVPSWQQYYDNWGCRAYLFSPDGKNTYDFGANSIIEESSLMIDSDELKGLGCTYLFSRCEISNFNELGFEFIGKYDDDSVPYSVYLYGVG